MEQINLEESLVKEGIISSPQLQTLKLEQERSSITWVKALRRLKYISEDVLIDFLSKKCNLKIFSLADFTPAKELLAIFPTEFAWKEKVIPLFRESNELAVGLLDPLDASLLEELRFRTGLFIKSYLVREEELNNFLLQYYDRRKTAAVAPAALEEKIREEGSKPTVVEAIDLLLIQASKVNASDIHIEPQAEKRMRLRLRVDGVLKEVSPPDPSLFNAFTSRIKIMANLDIAEKRIAQDGRFTFNLDEGAIDVRVSVIPTIQGESIVLRLLRQTKKLLTLDRKSVV